MTGIEVPCATGENDDVVGGIIATGERVTGMTRMNEFLAKGGRVTWKSKRWKTPSCPWMILNQGNHESRLSIHSTTTHQIHNAYFVAHGTCVFSLTSKKHSRWVVSLRNSVFVWYVFPSQNLHCTLHVKSYITIQQTNISILSSHLIVTKQHVIEADPELLDQTVRCGRT